MNALNVVTDSCGAYCGLSPSEITANYANGCMADNGVTTGLVYYAKLNEGTGATIADWSGNGLSSVATNGTWAYESMPGTGCLTSADLSRQLCYFTSSASLNTISYFTGEVLSANDYYAFGANMPGRNFSSNNYRYGFNGKENDPESGTQDYGMRIYNPNLGKFLSVDPLARSYPSWSPYPFAMNRTLDGIDLDGGEWKSKHKWSDKVETEHSFLGMTWTDTKDYTYEDLWRKEAGDILQGMYDDGMKLDCFDAASFAFIQFAFTHSLPVRFADRNGPDLPTPSDPGGFDPTLDNDRYGYRDKNGKWNALKEGDWQGLANAVGKFYGAIDAKTQTKTFVKEIKSWKEGGLGVNGRHILTVTEIENNFFTDNDIHYIQGNDRTEETTDAKGKKHSTLIKYMEVKEKEVTDESFKDYEFRDWNFEYFDENK